jgi:quinolinate synthase
MTKIDSSALREELFKLKKNLNAIILAHNYQRPEVQDIADITVPCPTQESFSRLYSSGR